MSVDLSPAEVEERIRRIAGQISRSVMILDERYRDFLTACREYDAAYARAYLAAQGPAHAKKYQAELDTQAERAVRDVADAAWRYADRTAKALSSELDAYRSVGASIRQAYAVAGTGER